MPATQVFWIWVWIPTKEYQESQPNDAKDEMENKKSLSFEELVEDVKKNLAYEREIILKSADGNFKMLQFCVKEDVSFKLQ